MLLHAREHHTVTCTSLHIRLLCRVHGMRCTPFASFLGCLIKKGEFATQSRRTREHKTP